MLQRLERVLAANPNHPGACHLYIHAVEARDPSRALACAERLAALMPGAGHLVHMPGHIYIRIGRYMDAIALNEHAAHADGEMLEGAGVARRGIYANGYYPHNYHFLSFAASMAGISRKAIDAARETSKRLGVEAVRAVPWVETVTPVVPVTLVTFGRWKEILDTGEPGDSLPFLAAMTWYARGVAHAALGEEKAARRDLERLRDIAGSYTGGDNATALQIAIRGLEGEIALRGKRPQEAVEHFREAARLEDGLTYNEPPTWYYPIRHSLGLALLAAAKPLEAERVYREDLERFPRNGWSLFGLAQSLERQGKAEEARRVRAEFASAWKDADVQLTGSRF
jgi:tetratricopeptide (TPR) repeat protein